jgi:multidrug efflux pump subunit AcrB
MSKASIARKRKKQLKQLLKRKDKRLKELAQKHDPVSWMAIHPVAANLVMAAFILGGLLFLNTMKQEVFPDFVTDTISISTTYTGASPEEIERGIVLAIEDAISGLEGIDEISSSAQEGYATVLVDVMTDADINLLAQGIHVISAIEIW